MEKITVKDIVEFSRRSEKSQIRFINSLKAAQPDEDNKVDGGGGNYWVTASSAIGNYFKTGNRELVLQKIDDVVARRGKTKIKRIRDMFDRNVKLLHQFEDFDFTDFKPQTALTYLSKPAAILTVKRMTVQVKPSYAFSFKQDGVIKVGAVWFVVQLNGYKKSELYFLQMHFIVT